MVFRLRVAVLVPAMRAAAAACGVGASAPGTVRGDPRRPRAAGSCRDSGEARLHLPLRRLAGEIDGHSTALSACASVQSAAPAAPRACLRLPDGRDHAYLSLRLARWKAARP